MRKTAFFGIVAAASLSVGACATNDRYGYDGYDDRRGVTAGQAATGAAIGAAAGAGLGAVVDGVGVGEGAAVGAVVGGAAAAISANNRRWNRDDRGYCYYVNDRGDRMYDYDKRC